MTAPHCKTTGKVCYVSEREAERALVAAGNVARRLRKAGVRGIRRNETRAYLCGDCGRWHLTSWSAKRVDVPSAIRHDDNTWILDEWKEGA